MVRYGKELYEQLVANADYCEASSAAIPAAFRAPNETTHSLFLQADFGLVKTPAGNLEPRLVELQGFPSIYGFQAVMAEEYIACFGLGEENPALTSFLGGLDRAGYEARLRKAILNEHAPEEVVLLEIDPWQQKTLPDFLLTQQMLGLRVADIREVKKRGSKVYIQDVEIKRIYNRVIAEELERRNIVSEFRLTDDVEVEWAGHPNWFFRISKFSLPWLRHPSVPETEFLNEVDPHEKNLDDYVLKPLYSFAGQGVKIGPSKEEIQAIPIGERAHYVLQRKVNFVSTIETPSGLTKAEVRIMYIWDGEMKPVTTLLRLGRGKMMGVDYNRDLDWVGASAGLFLAE